MEDCIFCKIAKGEIKSFVVHEDDLTKSFLDVNPVSPGHTLIIPKEHYENIQDIPEKVLKRITAISKKLSKNYREKLNVSGFNLLNASGKDAQQSVFHFHMHLVPRYPNDNLDLWFHGKNTVKETPEETFSKIKS
jgi:histidine triad (HIT) family protein